MTQIRSPRRPTPGAVDNLSVPAMPADIGQIRWSRHIRGVTLPRVQPIISTWRKKPFDDPDWLFEFKYDGSRGFYYIEQTRCRFISRSTEPTK